MAAIALVGLSARPAAAFHKQSPTIIPLTLGGDTDLPRLPSQGRRAIALALGDEGQTQIVRLLPFKTGPLATILEGIGNNGHPSTALNGRSFAWHSDADPFAHGTPGTQVFLNVKGELVQAAIDPSGTSRNPSLGKRGRLVAFESEGNLAAGGNAGARQIFLRDRDGFLLQVSSGVGTSSNPMLSAKHRRICYQSTSDPSTGADTGINQVFVGRLDDLPPQRITDGASDSTDPVLSDDGRVLAFQSTADLAGDGSDTGIPQIFIYDAPTETYAQITDDATGCTRPAIAKIRRDYRVTFVCDGSAYFFMLRANQRYHDLTTGGTTQTIFPEMGTHFVMVSTTANLMLGGTTTGYRLYMLNLFKRPATPVFGARVWFPSQGLSDL